MNIRLRFVAIVLVLPIGAIAYFLTKHESAAGLPPVALAYDLEDLALSPKSSEHAFSALPAVVIERPDRVELGRRLFSDTRLSGNDSISCHSCHDLGSSGGDSRKVSIGIGGRLGSVNAPTVFNSGFNFVQFWDGRAKTLEDQVAGPVHNPVEMGTTWAEIVAKVDRDETYRREFTAAYAGVVSAETIADAIATFERTLVTEDSNFDRFLRGESGALDELQLAGLDKFKSYGCVACHQGRNLGGNMYQVFGVARDYFADRGNETEADRGRFNVTKDPKDRHVFRVPSLRNVEITAPYFHDGSADTLEQAVRVMGRYQLGKELGEREVEELSAFLRSLTGKRPKILNVANERGR